MEFALIFSIGALLCGFLGLMLAVQIYRRPPRWLKGILPQGSMTPELIGAAGASLIKSTFEGWEAEDAEGGVHEMTPNEAMFQFAQMLTMTFAGTVYPLIAKDIPVYIAAAKSKQVAKDMASKGSPAGEGMLDLWEAGGSGIKGAQSFFKGLEGLVGAGVKESPWASKVIGGMQIAEGLGIDVKKLAGNVLGGGGEDNGNSPGTQESKSSTGVNWSAYQ